MMLKVFLAKEVDTGLSGDLYLGFFHIETPHWLIKFNDGRVKIMNEDSLEDGVEVR